MLQEEEDEGKGWEEPILGQFPALARISGPGHMKKSMLLRSTCPTKTQVSLMKVIGKMWSKLENKSSGTKRRFRLLCLWLEKCPSTGEWVGKGHGFRTRNLWVPGGCCNQLSHTNRPKECK